MIDRSSRMKWRLVFVVRCAVFLEVSLSVARSLTRRAVIFSCLVVLYLPCALLMNDLLLYFLRQLDVAESSLHACMPTCVSPPYLRVEAAIEVFVTNTIFALKEFRISGRCVDRSKHGRNQRRNGQHLRKPQFCFPCREAISTVER